MRRLASLPAYLAASGHRPDHRAEQSVDGVGGRKHASHVWIEDNGDRVPRYATGETVLSSLAVVEPILRSYLVIQVPFCLTRCLLQGLFFRAVLRVSH